MIILSLDTWNEIKNGNRWKVEWLIKAKNGCWSLTIIDVHLRFVCTLKTLINTGPLDNLTVLKMFVNISSKEQCHIYWPFSALVERIYYRVVEIWGSIFHS